MQLYAQIETIVKADWPIRQKIEQGLHAHLAAFDDNYPHMFVFVQELHNVIPALQDTLRDLPQRYQHLWEEIMRQGIDTGELRADLDVTATAFMILGMCNWMFRWYRKGGRLSTTALAQHYASAILDGIIAPSAS
jgi:hypothetical protein